MSDPTPKAPPKGPHCNRCWSVWSLRKCPKCRRNFCAPAYKDCMDAHGHSMKGGP
jgi:hypothetical protein